MKSYSRKITPNQYKRKKRYYEREKQLKGVRDEIFMGRQRNRKRNNDEVKQMINRKEKKTTRSRERIYIHRIIFGNELDDYYYKFWRSFFPLFFFFLVIERFVGEKKSFVSVVRDRRNSFKRKRFYISGRFSERLLGPLAPFASVVVVWCLGRNKQDVWRVSLKEIISSQLNSLTHIVTPIYTLFSWRRSITRLNLNE